MANQAGDVVLVRMPYSEVGQPSLALGLLKAACEQRGITTRNLPANLWFSEELGPAVHDMIFEAYSTTLIGEWTFSGALFPDFAPDDEAYLQKVAALFKLDSREQWRHLHQRYPYVDAVALLREIRRRAPAFIEQVADRVLALSPRIVGCTSTFQQHCASLALLRAIKQRRPDVVTMIGGANCEGDMGRATFEQFPWVDYVASGEADGFFGSLCERVLRDGALGIPAEQLPTGVFGPHDRTDPSRIAGLREGAEDGTPIGRLEDMDESPVPNYDDYFSYLAETQALAQWVRSALPFQTARGCWWGEKTHCSFCGISRTAMKFRAKSGDNVIGQMLALRDRYRISLFQGTEYIFDYRYFDSLLPRLKEVGGHFRFEVKANLKPEQFQAFVDSGTLEIQPGVESLNDELLGLLKKGTTACQNILLLKRARSVGLLVYWNLLHTIPGDRDECYAEMAEMIPLLTHLQSPFGIAQIHYDRFSPYWKDPAKHGLDLEPAYGYEFVYPFPSDLLKDMAYFFETKRQRDGLHRLDRERHPGLVRLLQAVFEWRRFWHSETPLPRLEATDDGATLRFVDTRSVATAPAFSVAGVDRVVYLAATEGITAQALIKKLAARDVPISKEDMYAALRRLRDLKVLLHVSNRFVSLALGAPVPPYLAHRIDAARAEMNPTWARLQADRALDEKRPNIALSCLQQPADEPITSWLAPTRPVVGAHAS